MKSLVFDSGPVITLAMNNLLWLLDALKSKFNGEFYISKAVKVELIDKPLESKKYRFEALQVLKHVTNDVIKVADTSEVGEKAERLLNLANYSFKAKGHFIDVVHFGEMEALALAVIIKANALVVDERTTRYLIEKPERLAERLRNKLHTDVHVEWENLKKFTEEVAGIKVVRSVELVIVAYEDGFLDYYITEKEKNILKEPKKTLLEAVLWAVKLNGCAISDDEIRDIVKYETEEN